MSGRRHDCQNAFSWPHSCLPAFWRAEPWIASAGSISRRLLEPCPSAPLTWPSWLLCLLFVWPAFLHGRCPRRGLLSISTCVTVLCWVIWLDSHPQHCLDPEKCREREKDSVVTKSTRELKIMHLCTCLRNQLHSGIYLFPYCPPRILHTSDITFQKASSPPQVMWRFWFGEQALLGEYYNFAVSLERKFEKLEMLVYFYL